MNSYLLNCARQGQKLQNISKQNQKYNKIFSLIQGDKNTKKFYTFNLELKIPVFEVQVF